MSCPLSFLTTSARFSLLPCLCVLFCFALVCFVFCFAVVGRLFLSEGEKQRQRSTFLVSLLSLFLRCRRLLGCLARGGAEGTAAAVDVDVCGWFVKNKAERKVGTRKPQGTKKKNGQKHEREERKKSKKKKQKTGGGPEPKCRRFHRCFFLFNERARSAAIRGEPRGRQRGPA